MKKKILWVNCILLLAIIIFLVVRVKNVLGEYIYPLDDAYIHLAIAKNFALDGLWGITKYQFSSTTSSPLFTFILSLLIKIFGNHQYIPIYLNLCGTIGIIYLINKELSKYNNLVYAFGLTAIIWLMPMHLMILMGMEHILHTLAMVLFFNQLNKYIHSQKNIEILYLYGLIATGLRYESLFFIFFACVYLFFVRKKFVQSIFLGLISISPVIIYGLISISQGAYFLPNSLILKGNTSSGLASFLMRILSNGYRAISLLPLVIILINAIFIKWKEEKSKILDFFEKNEMQIIIFLGFCIHLCFANFGWLVRYEAYLLALLVLAILPILENLFSQKKFIFAKILVFALMIIPLKIRFLDIVKNQEVASKNIFDQQIQMARFLQKYYNNAKIVANDIGAITYFTDIHLLDIYGLGSEEIVEIRKKDKGKFDNQNQELTEFVGDFTAKENYDIAIVYEEWITMPDTFTKVAEWQIQNPYIVGGSKVAFYGIGKEKTKKLAENLEDFQKNLPKDIIYRK